MGWGGGSSQIFLISHLVIMVSIRRSFEVKLNDELSSKWPQNAFLTWQLILYHICDHIRPTLKNQLFTPLPPPPLSHAALMHFLLQFIFNCHFDCSYVVYWWQGDEFQTIEWFTNHLRRWYRSAARPCSTACLSQDSYSGYLSFPRTRNLYNQIMRSSWGLFHYFPSDGYIKIQMGTLLYSVHCNWYNYKYNKYFER